MPRPTKATRPIWARVPNPPCDSEISVKIRRWGLIKKKLCCMHALGVDSLIGKVELWPPVLAPLQADIIMVTVGTRSAKALELNLIAFVIKVNPEKDTHNKLYLDDFEQSSLGPT